MQATTAFTRESRRLVLIVAVVLVGLMTHGMYAGTGDEPHYVAIAHSLAFDGDLDLSNNYGPHEPLIAGGALQPEQHIRPGVGGVLRPVHDIGLPLLFVPLVKIAAPTVTWLAPRLPASVMRRLRLTPSVMYRHVLGLGMIALACVLAVLMFQAFIELEATPRVAFWSTLLVMLSPPMLIFSILFFTELLSALLAFTVFRAVAVTREEPSRIGWLFVGAACGALLLVHTRNIAIVVMLALLGSVTLAKGRRYTALLSFVAGAALLLAIRTTVIHQFWGTWIVTPQAHPTAVASVGAAATTALNRIGGLFFDQRYGLVPYAPVFLLAPVGLLALVRTRRSLALKIAAVAGAYLVSIALPNINSQGWTGGWSPPARFLVPIVPLMAIALVAGVRHAPRALVIPLLVLQIGIDAYFWQYPKYLWNDSTDVAAVCAKGGVPVCGLLPKFDVEFRDSGHDGS